MNPINAMTIPGHPDSVLITELHVNSGALYKYTSLLQNVNNWHKFVVSGCIFFSTRNQNLHLLVYVIIIVLL